MRFIFFGTSFFGATILRKLVKAKRLPLLVVTTPDKPAGRHLIPKTSPVKEAAVSLKLPFIQPGGFGPDVIAKLESLHPDYFVVAAYGKILPKRVLEIPRRAPLNVHPSLLPKHRGASPIQAVLWNGETETGVSIIQMDEHVDHGPLHAIRKILVPLHADFPTLQTLLANEGANLLLELMDNLERQYMEPWPQEEHQATYTARISKEEGRIHWTESAQEIERKIRALYPWPGTYAMAGNRRLKILKASVLPFTQGSPHNGPGKTYLAPNDRIAVETGKDYLVLEILQMEGKKPMASEDFLRGHPDFIGTVLT